MAKFSGNIGFAIPEETGPGVWTNIIQTRHYTGDVQRNTRRYHSGEQLINDFTINIDISMVSDPFATANLGNMRFVEWRGTKWAIESVEIAYPRINISLGGAYNGQ